MLPGAACSFSKAEREIENNRVAEFQTLLQ
jgi:hypothetical protein